MKRLFAFLIALLCLMTTVQASGTLDLEKMTRTELESLKDAIANELKNNHEANSDERDMVLAVVQREVEALFSRLSIKITWAWLNYDYTKDWQFYTLSTHIDYKDGNGKSQKPDVYAEVYDDGNKYQLVYLKIGDEVALDQRSALPSDLSMPLASNFVSVAATAAPIETIKVTAKQLIEAYDNNEVRADEKYKGKMLTITGKVNNISVVLGQTSVDIGTGSDFEWGISCYFKKDQKDRITALDKGDTIIIMGECGGKSFMTVTLNDCIILE